MARSFPLKVGRLVTWIMPDGRRRTGKVVGNVVGSTADVKTPDGVTHAGATAIAIGAHTTGGWKRP